MKGSNTNRSLLESFRKGADLKQCVLQCSVHIWPRANLGNCYMVLHVNQLKRLYLLDPYLQSTTKNASAATGRF